MLFFFFGQHKTEGIACVHRSTRDTLNSGKYLSSWGGLGSRKGEPGEVRRSQVMLDSGDIRSYDHKERGRLVLRVNRRPRKVVNGQVINFLCWLLFAQYLMGIC